MARRNSITAPNRRQVNEHNHKLVGYFVVYSSLYRHCWGIVGRGSEEKEMNITVTLDVLGILWLIMFVLSVIGLVWDGNWRKRK